jgi:hypothetical protein
MKLTATSDGKNNELSTANMFIILSFLSWCYLYDLKNTGILNNMQ